MMKHLKTRVSVSAGLISLFLFCNATQAVPPTPSGDGEGASGVEVKRLGPAPVPMVAGIARSPQVNGVSRLRGLQELPPVPDQFGGSPSGDGRLWLGGFGRFCLVVEHTVHPHLSSQEQELAQLGKLPWWPSPAARQVLTFAGQWELDTSHSPPDLVLKGDLAWYPVFSPPRDGAALTDPPCQMVAQYQEASTPAVGPIAGVEEILRLSPDPTQGTSSDAKVEYLMVQTPVQRRRLPYVGFEL